jgi:hypothetical protein
MRVHSDRPSVVQILTRCVNPDEFLMHEAQKETTGILALTDGEEQASDRFLSDPLGFHRTIVPEADEVITAPIDHDVRQLLEVVRHLPS